MWAKKMYEGHRMKVKVTGQV